MIEVYVGLTLLGLGYLLNQNNPQAIKMNPTKQINASEMNVNRNVYDSTFFKTASLADAQKAQALFKQGVASAQQQPAAPQVVLKDRPAFVKSPLTGMNVPASEFRHNNMVPFGRVKQASMDRQDARNSPIMESFTGSYTYYKPKQEVESLFQPTRDLGNVHGMPNNVSVIQERIAPPRVQNNTLPFTQVRVGPALNRGYNSQPEGGFQQYDARDYAMPKTVDELRVATKPKQTFAGRVVDGQKGSRPGTIGAVNKNRVDTYFAQGPERYFTTTGAVIKPAQHGKIPDKATNRQDTTRDYAGTAYQPTAGEQGRPETREPMRVQLNALNVGAASLTDRRTANNQEDYGKSSILVYRNERDITTTRTRAGNVTSLVKAIIAPIEDLLKITKKDALVDNPRQFGQLQATIPPKATVYDPNSHVLRTTLKETLIHDAEALNLKGPAKLQVYDPNAHVARTTIKETLLHDAETLNIKGDRSMGAAYDPETIKARTTLRQTMPAKDTNVNLQSRINALPVKDPEDVAKKTIKETVIDLVRQFGNVDRAENFKGSYEDQNYDVPTTQREETDGEYAGNPHREQTNAGYQVVDATPRETQRQEISDNDYYGGAKDQSAQAPMSYEDIYNAEIDGLKEETLLGRDPTQSGVKVFSGVDEMSYQVRKSECDLLEPRDYNNADRVVNKTIDNVDITLTRNPQVYEDATNDRLDEDILDALKDNPYVLKSLGA